MYIKAMPLWSLWGWIFDLDILKRIHLVAGVEVPRTRMVGVLSDIPRQIYIDGRIGCGVTQTGPSLREPSREPEPRPHRQNR